MTKLVPISGRKLCKILEKLGFQKIHQRGSHVRYKHEDVRITVVIRHITRTQFSYFLIKRENFLMNLKT